MELIEEIKHPIKWTIEEYLISEKLVVFSKHHRRIKQTMVNSSVGYYINGKFRTIKYIRNNCELYKEVILPF